MIILLLGPQGSGKGTQARLLVKKFRLFYFEAGAFLREMSKSKPEIGERINRGELIPGDEMADYVENYLDEKNISDNILLDGFPRTPDQLKFISPWFQKKNKNIDLVIVIRISEEETIKRLSARRQDLKTGKIYNLITDAPPDDIDQSSLVQREDDKPEAIKVRLNLYKENTEPLITKLKETSEVLEVDGERSIAEIQKDLVSAIEGKIKNEASNN